MGTNGNSLIPIALGFCTHFFRSRERERVDEPPLAHARGHHRSQRLKAKGEWMSRSNLHSLTLAATDQSKPRAIDIRVPQSETDRLASYLVRTVFSFVEAAELRLAKRHAAHALRPITTKHPSVASGCSARCEKSHVTSGSSCPGWANASSGSTAATSAALRKWREEEFGMAGMD